MDLLLFFLLPFEVWILYILLFSGSSSSGGSSGSSDCDEFYDNTWDFGAWDDDATDDWNSFDD